MLDEPILRAKARGNGARCAICELPVTEEELKFEIHFDGNSVEPGWDMFHVHAPCFEAWEFERGKGCATAATSATTSSSISATPPQTRRAGKAMADLPTRPAASLLLEGREARPAEVTPWPANSGRVLGLHFRASVGHPSSSARTRC